MTTGVLAGLLLAIGSAVALPCGFFMQHRAASELPRLTLRRPVQSLQALFTARRWLVGFVAGLAGWALYVAALALAPLSLVQATSAGGIGLLALLTWRAGAGTRPRRKDMLAVAAAVGGLALLGLSLAESHTAQGGAAGGSALAAWIGMSTIAAAVAAAAGSRPHARGAWLGLAAGLLYSAGDVASKEAAGGALAVVPAVLALHGLAFVALQLGFQRGGALQTAGIATLLTNALPIAAGTTLFHEGLPPGLAGGIRIAAFATIVAGSTALAAGASGKAPVPAAPLRRAARSLVVSAVSVVTLLVCASVASAAPVDRAAGDRVVTIHYRAHDGVYRPAYVVLPGWYGPRDDPQIPLVISPHGRGATAHENVRIWGDLPSRGGFAVVNPGGQGRALQLYSWGDPGEIADLARMPLLVARALPWLRIDRHRIYAVGGSMGGQEVLLLVGRDPRLLAGAASFDAPTNMALRYRQFDALRDGLVLQQLARMEVGGTPADDPQAYGARSPLDFASRIAASGVPLELWWSTRDRIVRDQARQSGLLYRKLERLHPRAPVVRFVGRWAHTAELKATARLPEALRLLGLPAG